MDYQLVDWKFLSDAIETGTTTGKFIVDLGGAFIAYDNTSKELRIQLTKSREAAALFAEGLTIAYCRAIEKTRKMTLGEKSSCHFGFGTFTWERLKKGDFRLHYSHTDESTMLLEDELVNIFIGINNPEFLSWE